MLTASSSQRWIRRRAMPWTPSKGTSIHGVYSPTATCAVSLPTVTAAFPVVGSITTEKGAFIASLSGPGGPLRFDSTVWPRRTTRKR